MESIVESIGSVVKHHNKPNRNMKEENLNAEITIAWNGPCIPKCNSVVECTFNKMYSGPNWNFVRSSKSNRLKFNQVSEAVDGLQKNAKPYMFE